MNTEQICVFCRNPIEDFTVPNVSNPSFTKYSNREYVHLDCLNEARDAASGAKEE